MKKSLQERLAAAELRQAQAAARVAAIKGKQKVADRKRDTRRKIVVGAAVLVEMERDPKFGIQVRMMLANAVARPQDRETIADLLSAATEVTAPASNANTPPPPETANGQAGSSPLPAQSVPSEKTSFPLRVREKIPGCF